MEVQILSTGTSLETIDELKTSQTLGRLLLLRPKTNLQNERILGSHAKFCASDWKSAYIGSANFTGPGLSEQVEMGVLLSGPVVRQLQAFWTYCLEEGLFVNSEA